MAEKLFAVLQKYAVRKLGVQFAGPECLAMMKARAIAGCLKGSPKLGSDWKDPKTTII
jgi:hypothetical protein